MGDVGTIVPSAEQDTGVALDAEGIDAGASSSADAGHGDTGGCGCQTPASTTSSAAGWLAGVLLLVVGARRRR